MDISQINSFFIQEKWKFLLKINESRLVEHFQEGHIMFGKLFLSKVNAEELPDIDKIYQRMQKPDLMVKKREKLHTQKELRQLFIVFLDFQVTS